LHEHSTPARCCQTAAAAPRAAGCVVTAGYLDPLSAPARELKRLATPTKITTAALNAKQYGAS